jgi:prepilin-type N-terminal cleavage/methylation domain-containing protein
MSPGFTLVELMVTLTVFALVAVTLTVVLMTSAKSKQRTSQRIETEQAARAALDLMARDIRTAGYGVDRDYLVGGLSVPQQAIAYVDSTEIILSENQSPYPETLPNGPSAPLAYNPAANPKPFPLNGTPYAPPGRYRTGAELIRYTLDVNNDGAVNANDVAAPEGADAAATPNPSDYVLVRQVYGDSTGNVANNNGGTTERVALVRKPGDPGVPALFTVYMKGLSTPWDWSSGPVPQNQLANIQRVALAVTAASSRPDARGTFAQTTLKSEVNASRSVPDFGAKLYSVSGYVFNDLNLNHVKDGSDVGLPGALVRLGNLVGYTNASGFYQIPAPAGSYVLRHTPPMGYGSYTYPDTFNVLITTAALTRSFADTARSGGSIAIHAYSDLNSNNIQDAGEANMSGLHFTLTPGSPGANTMVTDGLGNATLFSPVGSYSLNCDKPDTLIVTSANPKTGTMTNGSSASYSFGLTNQITGQVTGKVFLDANRNGVLDGSETGLANVWVGVSNNGGANVAGYAYTDASGNYSVTVPINDPPHTTAYTAYFTPPAGYFPTLGLTIGSLWVQQGQTLSGKNFGVASFQVISLSASRVLSLTAADLIENDWNGGHTENARQDQDLILGADAGGTDNVSVWFNQYATSPLFTSTPTGQGGYTRLAPNSVLSMAADTLDKNDNKQRPDLVTGTKFTAGGNFFVWFTQGSNNNEGYLPTNYSSGQNYRTADNGDVQAVATIDCGGGAMPDILVGTKSATAGQGSIEVWLNNDATTPTFTRDETINSIGGSLLGEVTGMVLADLDKDGDKDLVVVTHQSDYNGQLAVFENYGRTAGSRWVLRYTDTFSGDAPTAVTCLDGEGDGWKDIFVGTQRSTSQGRIYQYKNLGSITPFTFTNVRKIDAPGFVQSLNAGEFGANAGRTDLAMGFRTSTSSFGGGLRIYYMDLGLIPDTGTDPSAGNVVNMVPALASANFNYGLNTTAPPTPYLLDLAAGVKASATTGALVIFIR